MDALDDAGTPREGRAAAVRMRVAADGSGENRLLHRPDSPGNRFSQPVGAVILVPATMSGAFRRRAVLAERGEAVSGAATAEPTTQTAQGPGNQRGPPEL